jgi:hypothetical protein
MGLSFIGHSPSFNIWVFSVDGRELVARNFSTQSPLQLSFKGVWEKYSGGAPLINTSGFNITESTDKVIVWTWAGKRYTSWWLAESDDIDDPEAQTTLTFGPAVPYSGPPTAPVGNGGVTNTQSPAPPSIPTPVPSLPLDQNQNIMGGGQNQVRIPTPVIPNVATTPAAVTPAAVTPAGTDWVKLGLQLGAAYLLLS